MNARSAMQRDVGLIWVDDAGRLLRVNATVGTWCAAAASLEDLLPQLDRPSWRRWREQGCPGVQALTLRSSDDDGGRRVQVQADAAPGGGWLISVLDQAPVGERLAVDALQRVVLGALATGEPLCGVLDQLCRLVEQLAPEVLCSVLEVDREGRLHPLAGPSLHPDYSAALDGLAIGPVGGSCGTAAWRREPVDVRSIATDPLWAPYKHLALAHGLAACWSTPVLIDAEQRVGATFALYYREEAPISPYHRDLVQACTQLVRVALMHDENGRRIGRLAYYDSITGLPNRSLFTERSERLLRDAAAAGRSAALLLMDLDRFKAVNEVQGHAAGNEVLRRMAQRLAAALPGQQTLARLGDDEFVVLLSDTDAASAAAIAQTLCEVAAQPLELERGQQLRLGISVGFSRFPEDGVALDGLLKHADIALNTAKLSGRNCARGFSAEQARELQEKAWMEGALREAMAAHDFALHFQPKLDLADGRLLGAEVLLRWTHAERGPVAPDRFIALAEEIGLVSQLDAWVLDAALRQLAQWRAQGLNLPSLSVNLSPPRLLHGDLHEQVQQLLAETGLPPAALTLEITERVMLDERQDRRAVQQLESVRRLGVGVSIDDFGTGYSCLGYLHRLPISELKIDRSFVRNLVEGVGDRALVAAVVAMARGCGLQLVAEGVETAAQADVLRELGCSAIQGYWVARPMPAAAFADWLQTRR
jgi:diguanylate cyclase (GGDEF)-like protein